MPSWQVIPSFQLHSYSGLTFRITAELAARYKDEGMLAYVNLIQKKEKEIGCDVLTHQKWYVVMCLFRWQQSTRTTGVVPITSTKSSRQFPLVLRALLQLGTTRQNIRFEVQHWFNFRSSDVGLIHVFWVLIMTIQISIYWFQNDQRIRLWSLRLVQRLLHPHFLLLPICLQLTYRYTPDARSRT